MTPQNPINDIPPVDIGESVVQDDDEDALGTADEETLELARKRMELAEDAENENRKNALDDLQFRAGQQWPDNIQQDREKDGRPCLVINRLPQFVQQVTNDQRQNRPSIKVHPVGDGADAETAKVIQGLIRHIEYNSNAEIAYDTAFESAVTGGWGYFRIVTDFTDPESFDQEIFFKRIRNPFSVFFDPYSQEPDGSDANFAFVVDDLSKDEYRDQYPDSELAAPETDWRAIGNSQPTWVKDDGCRVVEYFYKEMQEKTIYLLSTGETVDADQVEGRMARAKESGLDSHIVRTRKTKVPVVKWCKINGIEILEKTVFPVPYIPIIPVYGAEVYVDGKRILESLIRHAKDPQRMYNYWASAETEAIALAPRTPFIGAEGQFEGYEDQWRTANRRNHAFLTYKPTSIGGQPLPPPQRQSFEPAVQAITQARMIAGDDMKATTGVYDAGVGAQSNEVSGVAINARAGQVQASAFHFVDNLTRSLKHAGRILVELIPKIYDTERTARIVADDGDQKIVTLNAPFKDDSGKEVLYDMNAGRYGVTVDTGPSFASKRMEASANMMELGKAYPQLMQIAGDIVVKNMDWPGAQDIAERLKLALPPALQTDPKKMQIPPQAQAQMGQMQKMIAELSQHLNEKTQIIEQKQIETQNKRMALEHDERIEIMKLKVQCELKAAELQGKAGIELLRHQMAEIETRLQLIGESAPIGSDDQALQNFDQSSGGMPASGGGSQPPTGGPSPGQTPGA